MAKGLTAVLIIRAWVETDPSFPFRATIRRTLDVSTGFGVTQNFADASAVREIVRAWLHEVAVGGEAPPA